MNKRPIMKMLLISTLLLSTKVSAETTKSTSDTSTLNTQEQFYEQSTGENESVSKESTGTSNPSSEKLPIENTQESVTKTIEEKQAANSSLLKETGSHEKSFSQNRITNGDFSNVESQADKWSGEKPSAWSLWIPGDIKATNYMAQVNAERQLVFSSASEEFRVAATQKVTVDSSKTYELSFDIKTENLTNIARVRINEQNENGQTNLWHSKSIKGTNDWQTIMQDFKPNAATKFVTIELFFEKGTGTLYYDNVSFVEKDSQEEAAIKFEDKIEMHTNNVYLPKQENYVYEVSDSTIAKQEKGLLYPQKAGETTVKILDRNGVLVKEIPLIVSLYEETKYHKMLNQWNDVVAGNDYFNANNVVMAQQNKQLDAAVEKVLAFYGLNENPETLWTDLTDYSASANLTTSYRRVETLAKQVTQPASKYYQDQNIIRLAKNAMEWMYTNVYNENVAIKGNWWDYEIGSPRAINNTLSLMQPYFTTEEVYRYTNPINYFVPDVYNFRVTTGLPFKALGGNLIDMGRVKIISGALRQDPTIVEAAIESLQQAFNYANPGEVGFFEDGSYIDHENVALTGAYGNVLIDGLSQLLPTVLESGMLPVEKLNNLYHFIDDAFLPLVYKGEMMDMTRGRAISRQELQSHQAGGEVLRGMMRVADASETSQKNRLNSIIKTIIAQNTNYNIYKSLNSYKDIDLMDQLLGDASILTTTLPSRLAIFNEMDKVSYQNTKRNFAFGLSMYSDATQNYEYMNQENAHGWYTADGAVYLYNDDLSHYNDNYWATVDPYHIPGTTIIPTKRDKGSGMTTLPSRFVGGTKLDEHTAAVVMDFTNWNKTLHANKSWFIFNDKVVFLGSNIQATGETPAITTIENRKNSEKTQYEIFVNGEQKQLDQEQMQFNKVRSLLFASPNNQAMNIGYSFLEKTTLDFTNKTNQGSWQTINAKQSDKQYQNHFLTAYQTHSNKQTTYAYVMYPNISAEQLAKKEKGEKVKVLQNDALAQAVYDKEEKSWGIVLYEDQMFKLNDDVKLTKKGVYSVKKEKEKYILSYYNPIDETYSADTVSSNLTQEVVQEATKKDKSTILYLYLKDKIKEEQQ